MIWNTVAEDKPNARMTGFAVLSPRTNSLQMIKNMLFKAQ